MFKLKSLKNPLRSSFIIASEEQRIFKRYEKFLATTLHSFVNNFDQIDKIVFKDSKTLIKFSKIIFLKFICLLFSIRCIVNIFWSNEYTRQLTCDGYHYLGNPVMINLGLLTGAVSANVIIASFNQFFTYMGLSYQFSYMNKIKYRRLDYRLNRSFNNKFYRRFNWISKGVDPLFKMTFIIGSTLFCAPIFIGYFDPELNFNLSGMK